MSSINQAHALPVQMHSLIGRTQELEYACQLLQQQHVRLLTLTGPGGVGKTRLALEVAHQLQPAFRHGIHFVSLAPLRDAALVPTTIAQALSLVDTTQQDQLALIQAYTSNKQMLLVLDNFEHVLEAGPLLTTLLANAPQLKVLATSREMLHLYGEHEFEVLPLALPHDQNAPLDPTLSLPAAITLFVERAQAVKPSFTLTQENMHDVADICVQLDGLPLAIELAAARCKMLSPQALLTRLQHRLHILTGGARDLPARQQTLRNTLDWSYHLLTDEEQHFFRHLGIFVGTWSEEAATAVAMSDEAGISAFDLLSSLVDKSLVRPTTDTSGNTRFLLLETVREYALDWLTKHGELVEAQRRHALFYTKLAEQAEQQLLGKGQQHWIQRLDREVANLRQAMQWVVKNNDAALGLRLASALIDFLQLRGTLGEMRDWLEQVLHLDSAEHLSLLRARITYGTAMQALKQGDLQQARTYAEESQSIAQSLNNQRMTALSLGLRSTIMQHQGEGQQAYTLALQGLHLLDESNDHWARGVLHSICGIAASHDCNFTQAHVHYKLSLILLRTAGDLRREAEVLVNVGLITRLRGKLTTARFLYQKALALFQQSDDRWGQLLCLISLGEVLCYRAKFSEAQQYLTDSLELATTLGTRREYLQAHLITGQIAFYQGNLAEAAMSLKLCQRSARELAYPYGIDLSLLGNSHIAYANSMWGNACSYYEQVLHSARTQGEKQMQIHALCGLGRTQAELAAYQQANTAIRQAIQLAWEVSDMVGLAMALGAFAYLCGKLKLLERAAQFLGSADAVCQAFHIGQPILYQAPRDDYRCWLQEQIGENAFHENWMVGQAMTLKQTLGMIAQIHVKEEQPVPQAQPRESYPAGLTVREVDVLRLVAQGLTDVKIAQHLVLSPRTVNTHLRSIYAKLGVSTRSAATRLAVEYKLT